MHRYFGDMEMAKKAAVAERVRVTVSMDPEVLDVFKRMAESGRMSVGRCIGEWCADTVDGAQFVAQQMERAKKAPQMVMREMQALGAGLQDMVKDTQEQLRARKRGGGLEAAPRTRDRT